MITKIVGHQEIITYAGNNFSRWRHFGNFISTFL